MRVVPAELIQPPFRRAPVLRTEPPLRILAATVLRQSYADCGFRIDDRRRAEGVLGLDWAALAYNDGAAVEIVYTGSRFTEVRVDGAMTVFLLVVSAMMFSALIVTKEAMLWRVVTFAMWVLSMFLAVELLRFGIPRRIDVDAGAPASARATASAPARSAP